jgi:O-acetyl-ADP-ribose deacetylase
VPRIVLEQGDIAAHEADAIVNAANSTLLGGGGVDGAIHRRGGLEILEACRRLRAERFPDGLPTGMAVETTAGALPARWVIHTVGPVWRGGDGGEDDLLASCYRSSMQLAHRNGVRSIAYPSISTGVYGFPVSRAAHIAVRELHDAIRHYPEIQTVRVVAFGDAAWDAYEAAMEEWID